SYGEKLGCRHKRCASGSQGHPAWQSPRGSMRTPTGSSRAGRRSNSPRRLQPLATRPSPPRKTTIHCSSSWHALLHHPAVVPPGGVSCCESSPWLLLPLFPLVVL